MLQAAAATPVKKNRKTARGLGISAEPQSLKSLQVGEKSKVISRLSFLNVDKYTSIYVFILI
jgi:hypothetical protein